MENEEHDAVCACVKCSRPMTLFDRVPRPGGLPELRVFYCRACDEVNGNSKSGNAPTMWR
jgi:hypothetical protein